MRAWGREPLSPRSRAEVDADGVRQVPAGEEAAANCIRANDAVLVPGGFPATPELLDRAGYNVIAVPAGQAALLDGGLSCQSLRF